MSHNHIDYFKELDKIFHQKGKSHQGSSIYDQYEKFWKLKDKVVTIVANDHSDCITFYIDTPEAEIRIELETITAVLNLAMIISNRTIKVKTKEHHDTSI